MHPTKQSPEESGDDYLHGLASRYASELSVPVSDVLVQLEDLRLAQRATSSQQGINGHQSPYGIIMPQQHTYANIARPGRSFRPGTYASSSCLSDREEDDLYDYAFQYQTSNKYGNNAANLYGSNPNNSSVKYFQNNPAMTTQTLSPLLQMRNNRLFLQMGDSDSELRSPSKEKRPNAGFFQTAKRVICRRNQDPSCSPGRHMLKRGHSLQSSEDSASLEETRFMTRTRLRPGGPPARYASDDPQAIYGTPVCTAGPRRFPRAPGGVATPLVKLRSETLADAGSSKVQMFRTRVVYNAEEKAPDEPSCAAGGLLFGAQGGEASV